MLQTDDFRKMFLKWSVTQDISFSPCLQVVAKKKTTRKTMSHFVIDRTYIWYIKFCLPGQVLTTVPLLKGMEYTNVPGTCSAALLYHRGKWSALNTPSLSSAVRKSLRKDREWSWDVKDSIHQAWWRLSVMIRDDERWDSLIREVISGNEQIGSWQTSSCTEEGDLHSLVWVPVDLRG